MSSFVAFQRSTSRAVLLLGCTLAAALFATAGAAAARGALLGCAAALCAFRLHVAQVQRCQARQGAVRGPLWILARNAVYSGAVIAAVSSPRISLATTLPLLFLPQAVLVLRAAVPTRRPLADG